MNGKYLKKQSCDRTQYYELDNGFVVKIEWNLVYGDMVAAVLKNNAIIYHCSNGIDTAPEWIKKWYTPVVPGHWQKIIKPLFNHIY